MYIKNIQSHSKKQFHLVSDLYVPLKSTLSRSYTGIRRRQCYNPAILGNPKKKKVLGKIFIPIENLFFRWLDDPCSWFVLGPTVNSQWEEEPSWWQETPNRKLGFKMLVNTGHICHNLLPVRSLQLTHFPYVLWIK